MVKSEHAYCVRRNRLLSNLVTYTIPCHIAHANYVHTLFWKEVVCFLIHFVQPPENTLTLYAQELSKLINTVPAQDESTVITAF